MVFRISMALVAALVVLAGLFPDTFNEVVQHALARVIGAAGWM